MKVDREEYYIEKGYHQYDRLDIDMANIVKHFQKRFDDKIGKKYFIDIIVWDNSFLRIDRRNGRETPFFYEFTTQLYQKGTHNPINLKFFNSWTLEQVEEHLEILFATGMYDYYEEWD